MTISGITAIKSTRFAGAGSPKESGAILKWRNRIMSKVDELFRVVRQFFWHPTPLYNPKDGLKT